MRKKEDIPMPGVTYFQSREEFEPSVLYHEFDGVSSIDIPHSHDFFALLIFREGTGVHTIDFIDYKIAKHQIHLLFPGQIRKWSLGKDTIGYMLIISRQLLENFSYLAEFLFIKYSTNSVLDISPEVYAKLQSEFFLIKKELESDSIFWEDIRIRSRLISLIVYQEVDKKLKGNFAHRPHPILYQYNQLIDQYFRYQKTVNFYAHELNISPNYLTILCRRHFRLSAIQLIHQRVILEAKRIMYATEKSMKEIASELGFSEIAYFSHFFKSNTGFSPRHYRNLL